MALRRRGNRRDGRGRAADVHPVDELLPVGPMAVYGLQHVLSMYAGVVAVPLIVGTALKLTPKQITYLLGATMLAIGRTHNGGLDGLRAIYGALILAGLIGFAMAPFFTRLLRLFPPVVTGAVITVIGVSLLPVAVRWALGPQNTPEFGSQLTAPFHFGTPTFYVGATISMVIVMLVIMTETTADILAIGEVVDRRLDRRVVTGGLQADMLSTAVAGVFNSFSLSAFAQNVGLVAVTGIKSRFVVGVSGVILLLLGLFPVLGAIVAVVPLPVLGGAGLVPGDLRVRHRRRGDQRHPPEPPLQLPPGRARGGGADLRRGPPDRHDLRGRHRGPGDRGRPAAPDPPHPSPPRARRSLGETRVRAAV